MFRDWSANPTARRLCLVLCTCPLSLQDAEVTHLTSQLDTLAAEKRAVDEKCSDLTAQVDLLKRSSDEGERTVAELASLNQKIREVNACSQLTVWAVLSVLHCHAAHLTIQCGCERGSIKLQHTLCGSLCAGGEHCDGKEIC